jgi:hypothetical protein
VRFGLHFAICRAVLRCTWRRFWKPAAAHPSLRYLIGAVALAIPLGAYFVGAQLGGEFADALRGSRDVAVALAVALGVQGVVTGASVTVVMPTDAALGAQLRRAPVSRAGLFVAVSAAPLALAIAAMTSLAAIFYVSLLSPTAIGVAAAYPLTAATLLAFALGAALGEALLATARRSATGVAALMALGVLLCLGAFSSQDAFYLGPFGHVVTALHSPEASAIATGSALLGLAFGVLLVWAACGCRRPQPQPQRGTVRAIVPIGIGARRGTLVAMAKMLWRRRDLRRNALIAAAFAAGGGVALALAGAPEFGFGFASATAVLGSTTASLASYGLYRRGAWLWGQSPLSALGRLSAIALSGQAYGVLLVVMASLPPWALDTRAASDLGGLALAASMAGSIAFLAGVLVPWHSERLMDQVVSYGALVGCGLIALLALRPLVGALGRLPVPDVVPGAVACAVCFIGAVGGATALTTRRSA